MLTKDRLRCQHLPNLRKVTQKFNQLLPKHSYFLFVVLTISLSTQEFYVNVFNYAHINSKILLYFMSVSIIFMTVCINLQHSILSNIKLFIRNANSLLWSIHINHARNIIINIYIYLSTFMHIYHQVRKTEMQNQRESGKVRGRKQR